MERKGLLLTFATHPVAMNILMALILVVGGYVTSSINVQFFPDFPLNFTRVKVAWPGASAEDVERSVTNRLELELKNLDNLKTMTSTSSYSLSNVTVEFDAGTDIGEATDSVKSTVDQIVGDLPADIERPVVTEVVRYEPIASLILSGNSVQQLRVLANRAKDELLSRGFGKISIVGLPDEELSIEVAGQTLRDLGLSLNQIGDRIRSHSQDTSIGILGSDDSGRELRIVDQRRSELSFENVPIIADSDGRLVVLSDIATIQKIPKDEQISLSINGKPAVILDLRRQGARDTLKSAKALYKWIDETLPQLPPDIEIVVFDDTTVALKDRINVLINNGVAGLILVLIVLYLFLNIRVAIWVAAGIPISLMGAITVLYLTGGTLNMFTLFAFIMTIGIIVDDAIVVGEESLTNFVAGNSPVDAVYRASRRMFLPILAASLTTMFAFLPVLLVEGIIGVALSSIAIVVICVVAASLTESFLILPGHLRSAFDKLAIANRTMKGAIVDHYFSRFRDTWYRTALTAAIANPVTTVSIGIGCLILTFGLFASGRLNYSFFPTPELNAVWVNVTFNAGTPRETVDEYLARVENALYENEAELGGDLISSSFTMHGAISDEELSRVSRIGPNLGLVAVELVQSDTRDVRTTAFQRGWRDRLENVPGLENLVVRSPNAGPPGRDIEINLGGGASNFEIKDAALALAAYLEKIPGVYGVTDNTNYGRQQQLLSLTPIGQSLGLTINDVSQQLKSSVEGLKLQSFTTPYQDIEVRLSLPEDERNRLSEFENLNIILPSGESVPLLDVVDIQSARGFDQLSHSQGDFQIQVSASVDGLYANSTKVLQHLENDFKPEFTRTHGVSWKVGARQEDQEKTEQSMKEGALIAVVFIYLTIAWLLGSYSWPFFVMLAIPFGIVGAAWGHFLLDLPFTIISILGLIGLSGIVVNNAIVLVVFYKQNLESGEESVAAMIDAGCKRLRPVVLASLTTIVGLLPLLFETSTQAQFLIPMVATLIFGLGFSSLLVLFFVPAVVTLYDRTILRLVKGRQMPAASETEHAG